MRVIKNSKAYDGADVKCSALGQYWDEVVACSYSSNREHQPNHTLGSHKMTSWSMGKETNQGSLTLMMNQAVSLQKAARMQGGSLLDIKPFAFNVTFSDDYNALVNDTIVWKFASEGREVSTEMGLAYQYEMFVLSVDSNNV